MFLNNILFLSRQIPCCQRVLTTFMERFSEIYPIYKSSLFATKLAATFRKNLKCTQTHTCHEIKEIKINEFRSFVWVCVEIRCDCTISMKPCSHSILMNYYICMVIKLINELILHWFLKSYFKSRHSVPALSIFAHFKNRLEPACDRSVIVEFDFFCEKCRDLKRQIE